MYLSDDIDQTLVALQRLGIEARLSSGGRRLRLNCPFCSIANKLPDNKLHLYVSLYQNFALCYRCGWRGSKHAVEDVLGVQLPYLSSDIAPDVRLRPLATNQYNPPSITLPPHLELIDNPGIATNGARSYLNQRGITDADIKRYRISIGVKGGRHNGRIIIPITYRGRTISFVSREFIFASKQRYMMPNADEIPDPTIPVVWNLDCNQPNVVLCEGILDAIKVGDYAIATLGSTPSEKQVMLIAQHFDEVTILYDADVARPSLVELAERLLLSGIEPYIAICPHDDPCKCSSEEIAAALADAVSIRDTINIVKLLTEV